MIRHYYTSHDCKLNASRYGGWIDNDTMVLEGE